MADLGKMELQGAQMGLGWKDQLILKMKEKVLFSCIPISKGCVRKGNKLQQRQI